MAQKLGSGRAAFRRAELHVRGTRRRKKSPKAEQVYHFVRARRSVGRAKNVKEIDFSAICGERKQMPRFDVSRWNYGVVIESMEGRPCLGGNC